MQVIDVISSAMRLCGSLAPGEVPNGSEGADFFQRLNDRIDELNSDRGNLLPSANIALTPASPKAAYKIGPGAADFNQPRPAVIESFSHVVGGLQHDVELVSSDNYASIRDRSATSLVVSKLWCDYGNPIATLTVWPIPSVTPTFQLFSWSLIPQFATLFDTVALPPAWQKFLQFDLALNIAADLGTPDNILNQITPQAIQAYNNMRGLNQQYFATAKGNAMLGIIPTVGVPKTTGMDVASQQLGGPVQMVPAGGGQ